MPVFTIFTSQPRSKIPENFLKDATEMIAQLLGKPASFVCVHIHPDQVMSFGGSDAPCASVELSSIGRLGPEVNDAHAAAIAQFIFSKLGVPIDRFYIRFSDLARSNVGWNGKTFAS